ncbi:MAG: methyltransferase domain-containing protein [Firmicutes bacterium]|nr:methyltransferase domain-containing protein [Bacillota bacterium]
MAHRFKPEHMDRLLSTEREKMISPETVWKELGVTVSSVLADIGAGPGFFAIRGAKLTHGAVHAVDIEPQMLERLSQRAAEEGLTTVQTHEGNAQAIPLPDHTADQTLCAFVLHEVDDLAKALGELRRITKPGGRVGMLEWEKKDTPFGPPLHERLAAAELIQAAKAAGFVEVTEMKPNDVNYLLVCTV